MWWPGNISTAIEAIVADQKLLATGFKKKIKNLF